MRNSKSTDLTDLILIIEGSPEVNLDRADDAKGGDIEVDDESK